MGVSDSLTFDLRVAYPGFALEAAAEIPATGITVLSGPSGSGKSTLLRALAGLESRAEGRVQLGPKDWSKAPPAMRNVGFVFQDARLFPHLDVAGNLDYGARRRGTSAKTVASLVEALDLGPLLHRNPANLSGGEARRVALGRALATGPRVLLMDEPLSGLDRARKYDLMPYIARAVANFGGPALYVTHSAYEIGVLADRVLSIADGQLTGWSGPAPRLWGRVSQSKGGWVELSLGDQHINVQGYGQVGEAMLLPLGKGCLVTGRDPGPNTAAATLLGQLQKIEAGWFHLKIAGQDVWQPADISAGANWSPGQPIWLTLPRGAGPLLATGDSN